MNMQLINENPDVYEFDDLWVIMERKHPSGSSYWLAIEAEAYLKRDFSNSLASKKWAPALEFVKSKIRALV